MVRLIAQGMLLLTAWTIAWCVFIIIAPKHWGNSPSVEMTLVTFYAIGIGALLVLLRRRYVKKLRTQARQVDSTEALVPKRRRIGMIVAKIAIVVLLLQFMNLIRLMRDGPLVPLAVAAAICALGILVLTRNVINSRRTPK
jgi:hypothetical protein